LHVVLLCHVVTLATYRHNVYAEQQSLR
jgi:hypothetical protein